MNLKKFQREYKAKADAGKIETDLYEISVDMQKLKKELELIIDLYQQGEAKSEDAQEVVNLAESALVGVIIISNPPPCRGCKFLFLQIMQYV